MRSPCPQKPAWNWRLTQMRMHHTLVVAVLAFTGTSPAVETPSSAGMAIGPDAARPVSLTLGGNNIALSGDGGFRIYDGTAKKEVALPQGKVAQVDGKTVFECKGPDMAVRAEFAPQGEFVLVRGEVENLRGDERGFLVDYRIPLLSAGAAFSNGLDHSVRMADAKECEGNAFPVAAMCDAQLGVAMAIPPSEPRVFGMVGDGKGMVARFYLGTSPKPKRFPHCASFVFILYGVEPGWGFRSALGRYYGFFPDYYTPRLKRDGLFMFQMKDRVPPNVDQYGFDMVEAQWDARTLKAAIARDEQHGIATFPYMIVGQREMKFLPALPKSYEEAMAIYEKWTVADHAGRALTKENVCCEGDIHLKQEVEASACNTRDGQYSIVVRNTKWGDNSVTFKINPNPDLFRDEKRPTVASFAFDLMDRWLKEHPEYDGLFTDSLGANWPAALNYRPDHFIYARYPLTLDPDGRVALHNEVSHYEYLETLRARMRAADRLLLANGVYAYKSHKGRAAKVERQVRNRTMKEFIAESAPPEPYRVGAKLGRFFCAALLDAASCEFGVRATVEQCQDIRVLMGRKHFAFLNYHWEDRDQVEEFVNKSLGHGIFASNSSNFFTDTKYEDHPNGYLRDQRLLEWYVPLVRQVSRAGWEPVRHATVNSKAIACERFGRGDTVYFTLYNDSTAKAACALDVDLRALGFADNAAFAEIARQSALRRPKPGSVVLDVEPKRTCIIQISKP